MEIKRRIKCKVHFSGNSIQSLGSIALVLEIPTVSNKTAAIAAKFEISDDVVVIILGHPHLGSMGSTINCGLITEMDEEFTKKGIKKEIRNWINNFKITYGVQINDQEIFNHQPEYQVHNINLEPNQEKYKVVEVKHQEWKEVQDQFIINHLKENYKEVFESLDQVPPSRKGFNFEVKL
ncbi:hypothetical protein ACTFIW_002269 [Dictyostelium discoideum]